MGIHSYYVDSRACEKTGATMTQQCIGVKAIIKNNDGKILLLRRSAKYNHLSMQYDIPGGKINFGEEPEEGLEREVKEETNLDVKTVERVLDVRTIFKDDTLQIIRITYLCTVILASLENIKLSDEHVSYTWMHPHEMNEQEFKDTQLYNVLRKLG